MKQNIISKMRVYYQVHLRPNLKGLHMILCSFNPLVLGAIFSGSLGNDPELTDLVPGARNQQDAKKICPIACIGRDFTLTVNEIFCHEREALERVGGTFVSVTL